VRRDLLWIVRSIICAGTIRQQLDKNAELYTIISLMPPYPSVQVIDSHTAGEPTRVVIDGGPDLGCGPLTERLACFRDRYDYFRSGVVNEPRGSDVVVGAILLEPFDRTCKAAVIYFNNVGYLGMCGHGTIGLVRTLEHMGRIGPGEHRIETPSGVVTTTLQASGQVTVENVPAYRLHKGVSVDVPGYGAVTGDVAWGGNWFFLTSVPSLSLALTNIVELSTCAQAIKMALADSRITGMNGGEIDHIELFGAPESREADSRNFVLCPGNAYDRSPCGTGTSAKMACLHADGHLVSGKIWRQEGILGTYFDGSVAIKDGQVIPSITGEAYITGEARLFFTEKDPFRWGIA
jgi:4-hydroxyproline epimerase